LLEPADDYVEAFVRDVRKALGRELPNNF